MAYSSATTEMKQEAVKQLLNCDMFVDALDAVDIEDKSDLVDTHIFTYPINPDFIHEPITFVNVTVQVPKIYSGNSDTWCHPVIEFRIVSHINHMKMDKKFKTGANRNDFISQIIDHLFNNEKSSQKNFGFFGQLIAIRNEEGIYNKDWVYRYIAFETTDMNRSMCECSHKKFFGKYGYDVPEGLR